MTSRALHFCAIMLPPVDPRTHEPELPLERLPIERRLRSPLRPGDLGVAGDRVRAEADRLDDELRRAELSAAHLFALPDFAVAHLAQPDLWARRATDTR